MTTVIIDLNKGLIAADMQCNTEYTSTGYNEIRQVNKIVELAPGKVFVGAGTVSTLKKIQDVLIHHNEIPVKVWNTSNSDSGNTFSIVERLGPNKYMADTFTTKPCKRWSWCKFGFVHGVSIHLDERDYKSTFAFGSGGSFAFGAFQVCKDVVKAVEAANNIDPHSGLGVSVYSLKLKKFLKGINYCDLLTTNKELK